MSNNHTIILYKEDENIKEQREVFKNVISDIVEMPCMAVQKVSPVLLLEQDKKKSLKHPFLQINDVESLNEIVKKGIQEEKNLEQTFKNVNNKMDDIIFKEKPTENLTSNILKTANNEDERRNLDKINIFRGFYFAFSHQGSINFECNEESEECDLGFKTTNEHLKTFFDIEV